MNTKFFKILLLIGPFLFSCQPSTTISEETTVVNLNDSSTQLLDSVGTNPRDLRTSWNALSIKLPALKIPSIIDCKGIKDSVQFELTKEQREQLLPSEAIKQKDPVVSALYNLVVESDTVGTFYRIHYPVVYDPLNDITNQVLLVLYTKNGQYTDYKTLAINEYGDGYSRIKSLSEILYLYSAEKEFIETDLTVYDVSNKVSIKKVNTMHFTSRGSQEEYEKNNRLIEKLMK